MLSVPKHLRYFLDREPVAASAVLHILLRVVEAHLRRSCPGGSARARFGAVSFVHRFGASLNRHLHDHCCALDGVFDPLQAGGAYFRQASALAPEQVAVIQAQVRRHRYHGVQALNASLRLADTAHGRDADLTSPPPPPEASPPAAVAPISRSPAHNLWAMLFARLFESLPLACPNYGADMRIVAFVPEAAPVRRILNHIGEPAEPPRISPARGPPAWDAPPVEAVPD